MKHCWLVSTSAVHTALHAARGSTGARVGSEVLVAAAVVGIEGAIVELPKIGGSVVPASPGIAVSASSGADVVKPNSGIAAAPASGPGVTPAPRLHSAVQDLLRRSATQACCSRRCHGKCGRSNAKMKSLQASFPSPSSMQFAIAPYASSQSGPTSHGIVRKQRLCSTRQPHASAHLSWAWQMTWKRTSLLLAQA